jgi:hypothetical protein
MQTADAGSNQNTLRLNGIVSTKGGNLSGAKIEVIKLSLNSSEKITQTFTNVGGKYLIQGLAPGHYNIIASKNGYVTVTKRVILAGDTQLNISINAVPRNNETL